MKECVLLVDDCDALRRSIGEYLSMFGLHLSPSAHSKKLWLL